MTECTRRLTWPLLFALPLGSACGLFPPPTLEESLEEAVVAAWASEGVKFMGVHGSGPVTVVTPSGERTWAVEYPDEEAAGGRATGQLRLTELAAYPLYASEDFARRVHESALQADRRGGLTQEAWRAVTNGRFVAVGFVQAEVTRSTRPSREIVSQHAILPPAPEGAEASWEFQDRTRTIDALWRAVDYFYTQMMRSDDRVMECAKGTDPSSNRPLFVECATSVLDEEFGG